jgi:cysteine-S-conjugate beta-lyase
MQDHESDWSVETRLGHCGSHPEEQWGFVNTPVYRGSTVLFPDVDSLSDGRQRYVYGRAGNPGSEALGDALAELEGAEGVRLCPSGLSACTTAILATVGSGEHLLMTDNVYAPVRQFCDTLARRFGIETRYFDPRDLTALASAFRPNTRAVYVESPGSYTFELTDLPAVAELAHSRGARVICDNTWATPLFHRPLALGADLSVMAATKYIVGHSDALVGTVAAGPRAWESVRSCHAQLGLQVAPDDIALTLRGLRTLEVRLARPRTTHSKSPAGWKRSQRWRAYCIRRWPATRSTLCGSATLVAPAVCFPLSPARHRSRRSRQC